MYIYLNYDVVFCFPDEKIPQRNINQLKIIFQYQFHTQRHVS